jgi:hypothetical protein
VRLYVGAGVLVVVVLGAAWLVLAFAFGHTFGSSDAYARSAACVRRDPALATDRSLARQYRSSGLQALGIRWGEVRAVGLFADTLSPGPVDRLDARIVAGLERRGLTPAAIDARLLHEDNLSLYYPAGAPSLAAQKAIGRCVYLVHYNRIASALGIYISPHTELPFLPGWRFRHHDRG